MDNNKKLSKLYYSIYNEIVNHQILNKDTLESLKDLTHEECIKLLTTYNTMMEIFFENEFFDEKLNES